MASDIDAWWSVNFHKYSIRDLNRLPVFHRFLKLHYPDQRIDESRHEVITFTEVEDSFQWSDGARTEKISHNKKDRIYSYELSYSEKNCTVTVKSWVQDELDWGSIDKTFEGWQLHEAWKLNPPDRFYERFSIEQGLKRGFRCGVTPKGDLYERWVEEIWEEADEDVFKKTWEKVGQSGGETKTRKQDYLWGEEWYSDSTRSHQKCWHELLTHKWGSESGREGEEKTWEHNWDINTGHKLDEKISLKAGAVKGYRYTQNGEDWHKLEWQGTESLPVDQDSAEAIIAKYRARIDEIYVKEHSGSLNSDHTLRLLLKGAPGYKVQVTALGDRLERIHTADRASPADLLDRIDELRDLQDAQERLKQTMWEASTVDWRLFELYIDTLREDVKDSLNTLEQFSGLVEHIHLDPNIKKAKAEVEKILAAANLGFGSQISLWKGLLTSLESTKRTHLAQIRQPDFTEELTRTQRQQDLEDAVRRLYGALTKTHDFVSALNSLVDRDSSIKTTIEGLRHDYESGYRDFQVNPSAAQLLSLLDTLKRYIPIEMNLLNFNRPENALQDAIQSAIELVPSVSMILKQFQAQRRIPEEEKTMEAAERETKEAVETAQTVPNLTSLGHVLKALRKELEFRKCAEEQGKDKDRGGDEGNEGEISLETIMDLLEPAVGHFEELAIELSEESPLYQHQIQALTRDAKLPFISFRRTSNSHNVHKAIQGITAYHPLLKELSKRLRDRSNLFPSHGSDPVVSELIESLVPVLRDVQKLATEMSAGDPVSETQLKTLEETTALPFIASHKTPRREQVIRVLGVIRGYHQLLQELTKKLGFGPAMSQLEPVLRDVHRLATDLIAPDSPPELQKLELDALLPFQEYRISPKKEHLPDALKALRAYFPFLLMNGDRRAMLLLESSFKELHSILARVAPDLIPQLTSLQEKAAIPFQEYRISPSPAELPKAISNLNQYYELFQTLKESLIQTIKDSLKRGQESVPVVAVVAEKLPESKPAESQKPVFLVLSTESEQEATALLEDEKQIVIANNLILQTLQKANVPAEKPLTYMNMIKFFEEFMDKKLEVDTSDFQASRRPRSMTEFMMEHLVRQFGIKPLALKFLGQLIPGLQISIKENNSYAILFARLLQLFHPDPVLFPLALFLTRMRHEFHTLIEKCAHERESREKHAGKKPAKGTTFGHAQSDLAATGGEAFTADVILLVYDLFANDHHSGVLALQLLKPEGLSLVDYLLFCICHKMAKQGNTPEGIFNLIDKDGGGSIDQGEFVRGIKTSLDLWISEEDIIEVHVALAINGQLSKAAFLFRCNFDWYLSTVKSEEYVTTKCKFLNMLIDVFNRKQKSDAAQLLDLFQRKGDDPMTRETFTNVLKTLDSERNTDTRVEKIWNSGLGLTAGATALSKTAFIKVMLQYPSGEFAHSKFCKDYSDIPELESAVEDRKMETVDIDIKEPSPKKGGVAVTIKTSPAVKVATKKSGKK